MTDIVIICTIQPKQKPADDTLSFGKVFSDHMFMMDYDVGRGWHSPRIGPYGPFSKDPACSVLHRNEFFELGRRCSWQIIAPC